VSYESEVTADSPVGFWPLDGTTIEDVAGTNDGTASGTVTYQQTGPFGELALQFDSTFGASSLSLPCADWLGGTGQMTIEFWTDGLAQVANTGAGAGAARIVVPGLDPIFVAAGTAASDGYDDSFHGWTFFSATLDIANGAVDLRVNGRDVPASSSTAGTTSPTFPNTQPFTVYCDGSMYGLAMFDEIVSITRRDAHFRGLVPAGTFLVSPAEFEMAAGTAEVDSGLASPDVTVGPADRPDVVPGPMAVADPTAVRPQAIASGQVVPGPVPPVVVTGPIKPFPVGSGQVVPGPWFPADPPPPTGGIPAGPPRFTGTFTVNGGSVRAIQADCQAVVNGPGSGSVTALPSEAPSLGSDVSFEVMGRTVFTGIVTEYEDTEVAAGEESEQLVRVGCEGSIIEWADTLVRPDLFLPPLRIRQPTQDVRHFDYRENGIETWVGADVGGGSSTSQHPVTIANDEDCDLPDVWPDGNARWMWTSAPAGGAGGHVLFRAATPEGADVDPAEAQRSHFVQFWLVASGYAELWVNGVQIATADTPGTAVRVEVPTTGHSHLVVIRAWGNGKPGGVLFTALPRLDTGGYGPTLLNSRSGWWAAPLENLLAFSPGAVLQKLRYEAGRAGTAMAGWSFAFDGEVDSNGQPWDRSTIVSLDVGMTCLDVLNRLAENLVDWAVTPGARELRMWRKPTSASEPSTPWSAGGRDLLSRVERTTR